MATVREVLTNKINRRQARKAVLVSEVAAIQAEIDALQAERAALTAADDDLFARLQALGAIEAKD